MIIKNNLSGFYNKSEIEFIGSEINYSFMTPAQLNKEIADGITLFNELYPPPKPSGFDKFMSKAIPITLIAGAVLVSGGAAMTLSGANMGTVSQTILGAGSVTAGAGSTLASVQSVAGGVAVAGGIYGKVTGDTPEDLIKLSNIIKSENALDAMETGARIYMDDKGAQMQEKDIKSQAALRERLKKEQVILSNRLKESAALKAKDQGQQLTPQSDKTLTILAVATPFILLLLNKG